ncbi:hypothetical protein MSAN_00535200 [Mycena sanguinolenta]|uniref:Uncharacterized protein n=1 Tax=Mycena sanguinolenta TaxID=230812 RepID=A0A8H6Z642_9AGAR|nr:hypothetical protein MSAN_00535200 [Mycena sanguinolenta]
MPMQSCKAKPPRRPSSSAAPPPAAPPSSSPIPVTLSHLENTPGTPPAMHALAARKIIQDLEDGKHSLAATLANPDDRDLLKRTVKASVVRLGKTYSVASTHTSFVAVDETKPDPVQPVGFAYVVPKPAPPLDTKSSKKALHVMRPASATVAASASPPADRPRGIIGGGDFFSRKNLEKSAAPAPSSAPPAPAGRVPLLLLLPAVCPPTKLQSVCSTAVAEAASVSSARRSSSSRSSVKPASTYDSIDVDAALNLAGFDSSYSSARSAAPSATWNRLTKGTKDTDNLRRVALGSAAPAQNQSFNPGAPPSADPLEALARLQSFDGCFSLNVLSVVALKSNVDIEAVRAVFPAGASDGVIASILAMAFLANKLGAGVDRDSWEGFMRRRSEGLEAKLVPFLA